MNEAKAKSAEREPVRRLLLDPLILVRPGMCA